MKKLGRTVRFFCSELLLVLSLLFLMHSFAAAGIEPEISASKLFPGDAFFISVAAGPASSAATATIGGLQIPLAGCSPGRLCGIGVIPVNTIPGKTTLSVRSGADISEIDVTGLKPEYPERHIRLAGKKIDLSKEDFARVKKEAEKLKAIWPTQSERLFQDTFIMPLPNPVSTGYGVRRIFNRKKISAHQGVDVRGKKGEEIKAANRGIVVITDDLFYGGNTIILDHGSGIFTVYMHLDSFLVKPGAVVEKGQTIGLVGSTGRSTGPHLHFGLKILGISANPVSIIGMPVR